MTIKTFVRNWSIGTAAICAVCFAAQSSSSAAPVLPTESVPGSQGTDTALPLTPSAVTVNGRDDFAGLTVTVNQTANLTNQAVSVTWTGGAPTIQGPGRFGGNFLQIMQCWGDDDGTEPLNPGPPPEQCVQGAVGGTYEGVAAGVAPNGSAITREMSVEGWESYDPSAGRLDPKTGVVWRPFRAVRGDEIPIQTNSSFNPTVAGNYWQNPYFDIITTNEIAGASTGPDGTGAELFRVDTG
ncbi:MAG: hypothetical protein ABIO83_09455, partial [Ilumatobacteraceae bacterium]